MFHDAYNPAPMSQEANKSSSAADVLPDERTGRFVLVLA